MILIYLVILIFKAPFLIIRQVLKSRILIGLVVVAVIIGLVVNVLNKDEGESQSSRGGIPIPAYQLIAPKIDKAPTVVATTSRVYFVASFEDDGKVITLQKYYYYDKDTWRLGESPLHIDRAIYGEIRIYER